MSIHRTRGLLYRIAKLLGDLSAIISGRPGKVAKRVARRTTGKATGRIFRKLFK